MKAQRPDDKLFERATPQVQKLHQQAKRETRLRQRKEWRIKNLQSK